MRPTSHTARQKQINSRRRRHALMPLIMAGSMQGVTSNAQMPTAADVVAGQVAISQTANAIDVNASSGLAIVNWDTFSIAAGNTANFNLPSASAAILNRVTSTNMPSTIAGALNSNGHVYLVNPSGIVVSSTGIVNTNGFTASTFDVANDAFMAGGPLSFSSNGSNASIVNEGTIRTGADGAHLIANEIANRGSITSEGGNITLSGGGSVTLDNGVTYVQPTMDTLQSGISPTAGLIQNTGTIRATGAATSGGEVYLVNPNGKILHDGTIAASKAGPTSSNGGHIQLEADDITLTESSSIDATGTHGGGDVLVGGDWQGSGEMTHATAVTMETGAMIDASATQQGDGGKIVLWSDVHNLDSVTKAFGTLIARAGALFGDGGQIETSGQQIVTDGISVDAAAPHGNGGHWLIDPYNYVIDAVAASNIVSALNGGTSVTVTTTANNSSYGSSGSNADLGDITVASDIVTGAMPSDTTLTLQAARHISVDANIDATQNGNTSELNLILLADIDGSGDGINIVSGGSLLTNGGDLQFGDGTTASIGGTTVKIGGDVYFNSGSAQTVDTAGGDIAINGETIVANTNGLTLQSAGGDLLFDGVVNSGNSYSLINSDQTWTNALTAARNGTGDAIGDTYLATITSRLENALAGIAANYAASWLGGRRVTGIGTDASWRWVAGPEGLQDNGNGLIFANQSNSGGATPVDGAFTNWNGSEPNNWNGSTASNVSSENESALQFTGNAGLWNDLPRSSAVLPYVVETNLTPSLLTIDSGSGAVTFQGGIGGGKALASLNVTSGSINVTGDALVTTGAQNYSSALTVNSSYGLNIDGTTLTTGGTLDFTAADDITLGASVSASGDVSITGDVITLSGNQSIDAGANDISLHVDDVDGAVLTMDTTGHFTFAPNSTAWNSSAIGGQLDYTGAIGSDTFVGASDVDWLTINNYSTLSGLTLGKDGNTSSIFVYTPVNIAGPVSLIGNDITIDGDITAAAAGSSDILLKASGNIDVKASKTMQTNNGDITLWSDSDANSNGGIVIRNNVTFNSANGLTDQLSGGGAITLGGGADGNADDRPDGVAFSTTAEGIQMGTSSANHTTIESGGGDVSLKGQTSSTASGDNLHGVVASGRLDINAGNGTINIFGESTDYAGVRFSDGLTGGTSLFLSSSAASGTAISIEGVTTKSSSYGLNFDYSSTKTVQATGGGDIELKGTGTGSQNGIYLHDTNVLASTGDITIDGGVNGIDIDDAILGQKAGTDVTSASGNVTLTGDRLDTGGASVVETTGVLTVDPFSDSFSSSLEWPQSRITTNSDLGGLVLGKASNSTSIVLGDDITTAGQQTYHGPLSLSDGIALTTTNSDITFNGSVNSDGTARSLTVNSGTANAVFNGTVGGSAALSALTVNGTASIDADIKTSGTQNWTDTITFGSGGDYTLDAGSLATQGIVGGANNISLIADSLTLNDDVTSTGNLTIAPTTAGTDIGVGNISGTFSFNNSDFAHLQDGFSSITIGSSASGDLVVGGLTALVDDLTLQAGSSGDLFVNDSLSWSSDNSLTLAAGQDIFVNSDINITGSAAGLNLYYGGTDGTSAPNSSNGYYIDVANRREINFAETTAGLKIGNEAFTLVDTVAALQGMSANGRYALALDFSLAGTTYTDAFYSTTFTGTLDGLGHELEGLTIAASTGGNYGLFGQISGASVRHLGVTNIDLLGQSTSNADAFDMRIGGIVGNVSGSGTTVIDGVWSTGVIATKQGSQQDIFYAGGIAGGHDSGTLQILRSFSTANVSSQGSHSGKMALGGLLGDSGDNNGISGIGGSAQHLLIDRSYATGSIVEGTYDGYYGSGGLAGVIYGDSATLTDSFSRSNVVGGISSGGIAGFSSPGTSKTYERLYTTLDRFGNGTSPSQSYTSDTLDAATNNGTQLPSGWGSDVWAIGELPTLKSVGVPASLLYVQVLSGTGVYGDFAAPNYQIVDADGNVVALGSGDYVGLGGVSGTGRYTLGQFTSVGTYNSVSYLSGLGFTGADANLFALNPFTTAGSYTITPRSITAVLANTGVDKVYDGTVNAGSGFTPNWSFTNIASGDSATLNTGSMFFNDGDVLDANLFTINGLSLAGVTGSNGSSVSDYSLSNTSASVAANITAKPIVVAGIRVNDKIYDGTTTATADLSSATLTGTVGGDDLSVASATASFAIENAGTGLDYVVNNITLTGDDISNYALPSGTTLNGSDGAITPMGLTITAPTMTKVYDGNTGIAATATQLQDWTTQLGVAGDTVDAITLTYDNKNVGTGKTLTASSISITDGNSGSNYSITFADDTSSSITRLGSVTWIGGATGDWNDPSNWAGGAVPDLANVANVVIPFGVTPTFDSNVAGPVQIDSFTGGNLQMDGGTLDVDDTFTADTLTQHGGTLNAGTLQASDFTQTAGDINVDDTFIVTNSFNQSPGGSIDAGGQVDITHTTGVLTINDVSGNDVDLTSTTGGVHLVDLDASGDLNLNADGDVTQDNSGTLNVAGTTTIATAGDVTLDGPNNDFIGPMNVQGNDVTINDSNGGLQLGDVSTSGSLDITVTDGDLTQTPTSQIDVATTTKLSATGDILLTGNQNQFNGPVDLQANSASIVQATGDLILNDVNVTNKLTATSRQGGLLQTPTGSVVVGGESNLTASREIQLPNAGNDFQGRVVVNSPIYNINSQSPLTIIDTRVSLIDDINAMSAQLVNDTFVRPANSIEGDSSDSTGSASGGTWFSNLGTFLQTLFQRKTLTSQETQLVPADVTIRGKEVLLSADDTSRK